MSNDRKLSDIIAEAKAIDEEQRTRQEQATKKIQERNNLEREQKALFSGEVARRLGLSVKNANSQLEQANLPRITMNASQGVPVYSMHFNIASGFIGRSLTAVASLSGDSIEVKYQRSKPQDNLGSKSYDLNSIDTDEFVRDLIEKYVELQRTLSKDAL